MKSRRKRASKQQQQQQSTTTAVDEHHNLDVPCCRLAREVAVDVFPEAFEQQQNEQNDRMSFGAMLRQHLLVSQTSSSPMKKKKRRKKKKNRGDVGESATAESAATQVEEEQTTAAPQSEVPTEAMEEDIVRQWIDRISASEQEQDLLPKDRDLASFLDYLQQQQGLDGNKSCLPCIDLNKVQEACYSMECPACQQSALSYWRSLVVNDDLQQDESNIPIILSAASVAIPYSPLSLDGDVDRAFDYVAMEEGIMETPAVDSSDEVLSLQQVGSMLYTTAMPSLHNVVNLWMKQILLSCGLPDMLSDADFLALTRKVYTAESQVTCNLQAISQKIQQMSLDDDETALSVSFDVKTTTLLRELDSECDIILHTLVELLVQITTSAFACCCNDANVTSAVERLWTDLDTSTIYSGLQAQQAHEGRLMQLANRPGVVPQMALNASHRSSYRTLVSLKLGVLDHFCKRMLLMMESNVYRTILCHEYYVKLNNITQQKVAQVEPRLLQLYEEQIHTLKCGNVKDMIATHKQHAQDLLEAACELQESLPSCDWPPHLQTEFSSLKATIDSEAEALQSNNEGDGSKLLSLRQHVALLTTNVLSQWRCSIKKNNTLTPLPFKVKRWMVQGGNLAENNGACAGGGGKRRVTCILVGLLYSWLTDRCKEWHAELTQKELLEMDNDIADSSEAVAKTTRAKKSRKKKKSGDETTLDSPSNQAGGVVTPEKDHAESVDDAKDSNTLSPQSDAPDAQVSHSVVPESKPCGTTNGSRDMETLTKEQDSSPLPSKEKRSRKKKKQAVDEASPTKQLDVSSETAKDQSTNRDHANPVVDKANKETSPRRSSPSKDAIRDHTTVESAPKTGPRKTNGSEQTVESSNTSTAKQAERPTERAKESPSPQPTPVDIGVVSTTGFQSAEGYLVERLAAVLRAQKQGKNAKIMRR